MPEGDFAPDEERDDLPEADDAPAGADDVPPVTGEPEQSDSEAAVQEENAETSLDQPSS